MSTSTVSTSSKKHHHSHSRSGHGGGGSSSSSSSASSRKQHVSSGGSYNSMDNASPNYDYPTMARSIVMLAMICMLGLGLTEIILGQTMNNGGCTNSSVVSPYDWLLTDGVAEGWIALVLFMTILYYHRLEHYFTYWIGIIITGLAITFEFAWMIVGSVMFWKDNYNYGTCNGTSYFKLIEAVLIIKYIWIFFQIVANFYFIWCCGNGNNMNVEVSNEGRSRSGSKRGNSNV